MRRERLALAGALALAGYHILVRPRLMDWGSTPAEREMPLPGDSSDGPAPRHTRAVPIEVPPAQVWPWLVRIGDQRPVTVVEPGRVLVTGTGAFVLERTLGNRTRLLVREPGEGRLRAAVPARHGALRALAGAVDYAVGEPVHLVRERRLMLGLKRRAEDAARQAQPSLAAVA